LQEYRGGAMRLITGIAWTLLAATVWWLFICIIFSLG